MTSELAQFGGTAVKLSRTPLGIIALFIVLVYAIAALVLGTGRIPPGVDAAPFVWFMVLFPVIVFAGFVWLVATRPKNLYGPGDFKDPADFLKLYGLSQLPYAAPEATDKPPLPPTAHAEATENAATKAPTGLENALRTLALPGVGKAEFEGRGDAAPKKQAEAEPPLSTPDGRAAQRRTLYEETHKLFVVHVLAASRKPGQRYDIGIYVKRHQGGAIDDVERAEFFLGDHWGRKIFPGVRDDQKNVIGIRTSAFGPFLCTCLVTFTDGTRTMLYRYIDFEMGSLIPPILE